jgi:hypothetical protein
MRLIDDSGECDFLDNRKVGVKIRRLDNRKVGVKIRRRERNRRVKPAAICALMSTRPKNGTVSDSDPI